MGKISRRTFLYSGMAMGGAAAGSGELIVNRLVSYANPPLPTRPGVWSHFATVCRECPAGCGMHLAFRDGRVTKAEGNPDHPVNLGRLCARGQAALQGLYDPDRLVRVLRREGGRQTATTWEEALAAIAARLAAAPAGRVTVVSRLETGSLAEVMRQFAAVFGSNRVVFFEPVHYGALVAAHRELFGRPVVPEYRLDRCDFILSFAADFLETWVSPVQFAREFASMHMPKNGAMGRLVYVGPRLSMTCANADDYFLVSPGSERLVALAMVEYMLDNAFVRNDPEGVRAAAASLRGSVEISPPLPADVLARLAAAFSKAKMPVALAGPPCTSSPLARDTAAATALLNYAAGSLGQSVDLSKPHALSEAVGSDGLAAALDGLGKDDTVVIVNCNLAYADAAAMRAARQAGTVVYLTSLPDETAEVADWVLPIDSDLECWGDYEPWVGVHGLMQPTMNRLYETRPAGDLLLDIARRSGRSTGAGDFRDLVMRNWQALHAASGSADAEDEFWTRSLRSGGFFEPAPPSATEPKLNVNLSPFASGPAKEADPGEAEAFPYPSIMLYDGRLSNRGWLQEAPEPVNYTTWGSCIEMHPARAAALSLHEGDVVVLKSTAGSCRAPVRIADEVERNTVALQLGQGHTAWRLRIAAGHGTNGFALIGSATGASLFGRVTIVKTGTTGAIIRAAATSRQHDRKVLQAIALSHLASMKPGDGDALTPPLASGCVEGRDLFPPVQHKNHRWAMAIDLQRCTGCGACAVACYAENNVAVVGAAGVAQGREMAWLKVPPYAIEAQGKKIGWIPVLCQQCDAAPCEPVCPVFASVHNEEGLNAQVFNRCIGTRYCSNNCPYKVRRFNWSNFKWPPPLDKQLNPEVTVRCRGVMEKCTFCVQRIRAAEYRAIAEGRGVREGEIVPACVQTCPAGALVFGDLRSGRSPVSSALFNEPRRYQLLQELNTKPAVIFLKRVILDQPL